MRVLVSTVLFALFVASVRCVSYVDGTCEVYTGGFNSTCAPYIANWNESVFVFPNGSQAQYLAGIQPVLDATSLMDENCSQFIIPFACRQLFAPCLTEESGTTSVVTRQPTCYDACILFQQYCPLLAPNSPFWDLLVQKLDQFTLPFLNCSHVGDPTLVHGKPLYPQTGYQFDDVFVPCNHSYTGQPPFPQPPKAAPAPAPTVAPMTQAPGAAPAPVTTSQGHGLISGIVIIVTITMCFGTL